MKTTKEEFKLFNNKERLEVIQNLDYCYDSSEICELLTSVEIETLDATLLCELGKAYNNLDEYEMAMAILDMIPEEERDALWYYRYGYSYYGLSENFKYDFETQAKNALNMLNKAVQLSGQDGELVDYCAELVYYTELKEVLENDKDKYPYIADVYFAYTNKIADNETLTPEKVKIYKKITEEDIKNIDDSWDMTQPMYWTANIYDSYEDYIKSTEIFTLEQRYLLAITWYFIEVNNGGHEQFFYNSTGIVWEDAINGFKLFGMNDFAENFQKVIDYFGGRIPFDREERWDMLEVLQEKNEDEFLNFLDKADDFIYGYTGENTELTYIKANPEKFVFDGYYYESK
ncbi:MAG: DMP19 family protein [Peptostreptococcaceae bacterium]|nr:DMP19 family protein [Peptostreptococcaceae bacterium]MDY5739538.1 DMP19 family protein [Anaerovoracaceae bacterium]